MNKNVITGTIAVLVLLVCASFISASRKGKENWISLFDGKTLNGWHGFNKSGEIKNWAIEDGAMVCLGAAADAHGGDIVTNEMYDNFELKWEWKISKGGNSGVMYHVVESEKYKAPYETGPEYQMIDDIDFPQKLEDWQKTGADYAMNTANDQKKVMPIGEWNTSRIIFDKGHVEHWLNGKKIIDFQAWDAKWNKEKAEGKWKDYPDYGLAKTGLIALQDHGNKAYFKNIMIRKL
ncbi:MAG: DUF1080 domain-containing protein [Ferruginibacter sp.]|nr:DUF1080 domain-containing protein [Ferruginibacter sp.]